VEGNAEMERKSEEGREKERKWRRGRGCVRVEMADRASWSVTFRFPAEHP